MKQLVLPKVTTRTVPFTEVDTNKFYGIQDRSEKGFLRCHSDGSHAEFCYPHGFTKGNGRKIIHQRASDLIRPILKDKEDGWGSEVVEFDTLLELAIWLEKPAKAHKFK